MHEELISQGPFPNPRYLEFGVLVLIRGAGGYGICGVSGLWFAQTELCLPSVEFRLASLLLFFPGPEGF